VEELRISQSDLNTKRMLELMAVNSRDGSVPLYMHVVQRLLREFRVLQQAMNTSFNYGKFRAAIEAANLTPAQLCPLTQRLDTLESFMPESHKKWAKQGIHENGKKKKNSNKSIDWTPLVRIMDLFEGRLRALIHDRLGN
jgi:hypothetical protein